MPPFFHVHDLPRQLVGSSEEKTPPIRRLLGAFRSDIASGPTCQSS